MKKYRIMLIIFVIVLSCFFGKSLVMANAEESGAVYERYYTDITIQRGDTLWSIAKTYNEHSNMDIRDYIQEIKQINRLTSDRIESGDSLTIVYFSEEPLLY